MDARLHKTIHHKEKKCVFVSISIHVSMLSITIALSNTNRLSPAQMNTKRATYLS